MKASDVLLEAWSAEAYPRGAESRPDPPVLPDAVQDVLSVGIERVAEIGDLVRKADLQGQKRIGESFDQLGVSVRRDDDRAAEDFEQACISLRRFFRLRADDDAVGVQEIFDRRTFPQKFGRVDDVRPGLARQTLGRRRRNGRTQDDRRAGRAERRDATDRIFDGRKIGRSVVARRRSYRDDDVFGAADRVGQVFGKANFPRSKMLAKQLLDPGFAVRSHAGLQRPNALGNDVVAAYDVAELGETDGARHTDVSRPDNADLRAPRRMQTILLSRRPVSR